MEIPNDPLELLPGPLELLRGASEHRLLVKRTSPGMPPAIRWNFWVARQSVPVGRWNTDCTQNVLIREIAPKSVGTFRSGIGTSRRSVGTLLNAERLVKRTN